MEDININTEIFQHHVVAYNVLASTSNTKAERVPGLVNTIESIRSYNKRMTNIEDVTHLTLVDLESNPEEAKWIAN